MLTDIYNERPSLLEQKAPVIMLVNPDPTLARMIRSYQYPRLADLVRLSWRNLDCIGYEFVVCGSPVCVYFSSDPQELVLAQIQLTTVDQFPTIVSQSYDIVAFNPARGPRLMRQDFADMLIDNFGQQQLGDERLAVVAGPHQRKIKIKQSAQLIVE